MYPLRHAQPRHAHPLRRAHGSVSRRTRRGAAIVAAAVLGLALATASQAQATTNGIFSDTLSPRVKVDNDRSSVELGVQFRPDKAGRVLAIQYYQGSPRSGVTQATLWSSNGRVLSRVKFAASRTVGWRTIPLKTPVTLAAGHRYVGVVPRPEGQVRRHGERPHALSSAERVLASRRSRRLRLRRARSVPHADMARFQLLRRHRLQGEPAGAQAIDHALSPERRDAGSQPDDTAPDRVVPGPDHPQSVGDIDADEHPDAHPDAHRDSKPRDNHRRRNRGPRSGASRTPAPPAFRRELL